MAIPVRISKEPDGRLCLESPYDAGFVGALKNAIPSPMREWHPGRKRWLIGGLAESELLAFLAQYCTIIDERAQTGAPAGSSHYDTMPDALREAFTRLYLSPDAPLLVAEASYKALARVFHPDNRDYGNTQTMEDINHAIRTIRRYLVEAPE